MLVKRIYYPLTTLGPGTRVGIWTVGCNKRCKGCMSKDLQKADNKYDMNITDIIDKIKEYYFHNENIGVTITGGEPFLQEELSVLVKKLRKLGINDILVYTGYCYEDLVKSDKEYIKETLKNISVLIDGEYIEELNDNLSLRGSSNQRILFFDNKMIDKYQKCLNKKREFEIVEHDGYLDFYGIFPIGMENSIKKAFKRKDIEFTSSND